jgi:hypothetical protein
VLVHQGGALRARTGVDTLLASFGTYPRSERAGCDSEGVSASVERVHVQ